MNPFKRNQDNTKLLNKMWNKLERLDGIRGDDYINFNRVNGGVAGRVNIEAIRRRIARRQTPPVNKIFQVRSWAEPYVNDAALTDPIVGFNGTEHYDRCGVYNCIEMEVNGDLLSTYRVTGTASPANGAGWPNRITDKQGATSDTYFPGSSTAGDDYTQWDAATPYIAGDVVELVREYTDLTIGELRKVSGIYLALEPSTNVIPWTNYSVWKELTVPVFNACEQYSMGTDSSANPKLGKFDIIIASRQTDNTGTTWWLGNDTLGNTRLFEFTGDIYPDAPGGNPVCNMYYGTYGTYPNGVRSEEGQLNYRVPIIAGTEIVYTSIDQYTRIAAMWSYGEWWRVPTFALAPTVAQGTDQVGHGISVRVDDVTIGLDGSYDLSVL